MKSKKKLVHIIIGWILVTALAILLFPSQELAQKAEIPHLGQLSSRTIIAPLTFEVPKPQQEFEQEKEKAAERVQAVFEYNADETKRALDDLKQNTDKVPNGDSELENLDFALASCAIEEAVTRHAGTLTETYTLMGQTFVQEGKNLTRVKQIVVTGGSLIHTKRTEQIAKFALYSPAMPQSLRPKTADVWVDRTYILAAMGLLSSYYPQTALRIMKKELEYHGHQE